MKKTTKTKSFGEMTAAELADATREFDPPIDIAKLKPLTSADRAKWKRAKASTSRSIFISKDAGAVWVRLDRRTIERSTRFAAEHDLSLSDVIKLGVKGLLAKH